MSRGNGDSGVPGLGSKPTDLARQVRNATQAQRYRRQWTEEIEDPDGDGDVQELAAAIDILERRFGDKLPANPLAAGLRRNIGDKRRSQRKSPPQRPPAPGAGQKAAQPRPAPRRRPSAGRSGRRFLPSGGQALEATGIPAATRSTAGFVMQLVGLAVGLALLYLFLTNAERAGRGLSAIEELWGYVAGGVGRIVDPVDPIGRRGSHAAAASRRARRGVAGAASDATDGGLTSVGGGEFPATRPLAPSRQAYHAARRRARARHQPHERRR